MDDPQSKRWEAVEEGMELLHSGEVDAAIDEAIANVKPLKSIHDEDDILSKPLLATILVVAGSLAVGLIGMSVLL